MRRCVVLVVLSSLLACKEEGSAPSKTVASAVATPPSSSAPNLQTPAPPSAAQMLIGTWQAIGFEAATPAGSASAAALNQQMGSDEANALRIIYTKDQIKISMPGQVLSSTYFVREDGAMKCTLLNGKDVVIIVFGDADHMVIDRPGNAFAAKMKMKRIVEGK